ncbi:MAG: (Fe-S)-binding protein, partial [Fervidicoccaceae archaeon]
WSLTDEVAKRRVGKKAKIVYFVGCVSSYMNCFISIPRSFVHIMEKLNLEYTLLGAEERCCGTPLFSTGGHEKAEKLARHNVKKIEELGAETVVTTCAGCYRAFKKMYPKIMNEELPFEVLHSSELLSELIEDGRLKFKSVDRVATYHDPCELGRRMGAEGVYEAPRKVIESIPGLKFIELPKMKVNSTCCGGCGMLKLTNPDLALKMAFKKLEEARGVGANVIVSGCASCKLNVTDAVRRANAKIEFLDLVELAAGALDV